uniref:Transforming acidic coiled-coil containing protein 3 n=1 Tax=Pan paniscus TaxID=9597 RepID=A0A2R9C527_PANPA
MSLQVLNDKNVSHEKNTENCDFLFSPPEVTGRSSVLHVSQKENVPPKNLAKAMKVTFQTPLRDPQTHRILSPSMASKLEAPFTQDDTLGLENSHPVWTQKEKAAAFSLSGGHACGAVGSRDPNSREQGESLELCQHLASHKLSSQ